MSPSSLQSPRSEPAPRAHTYRSISANVSPTYVAPPPPPKSNVHRCFSCSGKLQNTPNRPHYIKDGGLLHVLAAQTLKIASINGLGEVDKLENDLEDEIRYENRSPAKTAIGRLRRAGQHRIHSKVVLLIVVLLNIIDCLLVISELVLDFLHVLFDRAEVREMVFEFVDKMSKMYHMEGWMKKYEGGPHGSDRDYLVYHFLEYVLNAFVTFKPDVSADSLRKRSEECSVLLNMTAESLNTPLSTFFPASAGPDWPNATTMAKGACFGPFVSALAENSSALYGHDTPGAGAAHGDYKSGHSDGHGHDDHYSGGYKLNHHGYVGHTLLDVAHKLHYISVAILSVLVLLLIVKIFCSGRRFFKSRMQVFDGIVILISFTLDLVFIEGLATLRLEEFIIIIAFLLPWRILRVVNSLIAAVLDQQRLNLKIIYKQKKKISRTLSETTTKMEVMQRHIEVLQALCSSRGLSVVNGEIVGTRGSNKPTGKDNHHHHHRSSWCNKHGSSSGGLAGMAGMMALGKLAFQAADTLAPISNGYTHGQNHNNNNNNSGNGGGGGSDGQKSSLANGHAGALSSSDNVLNKGDHPSHELGTELTPVGHIKAESDSELRALDHELQQQGRQRSASKDIESAAEGAASARQSETTISIESDGDSQTKPNSGPDDTRPSPAAPQPPPPQRAPEIIASPSRLEADLDSVRVEVSDASPALASTAHSSSSQPASSPSHPPDVIPATTTTTTTTTAEPRAGDVDDGNVNDKDAVCKL